MLAALAALKEGMALVYYSLSRLARSTKHLFEISELVPKWKTDLENLSEKIDTTTAMGDMMFILVTGMAQLERGVIAERTSSVNRLSSKTTFTLSSPGSFATTSVYARLGTTGTILYNPFDIVA
jgi:hypothetical protein